MRQRYQIAGIFVFFLLCHTGYSQESKDLINSGELLEKAAQLQQEHKNKEAIALYKQISRSDTNYRRALNELSFCLSRDSNFTDSKKYAEIGLKLFPAAASDWFNLIANAYDDLGNKTEAQAYYDSSLRKDPNKYMAWFNKGISYYNQKKYAEAGPCFEKCLLIYPYYTSAHYFLGRVAEEEGDIVKAMLCFTTNLFMDPQNNYHNSAVTALANIAGVKDMTQARVNARKTGVGQGFELPEEILLSKVALDTKYKLVTDVEDPITRQLQVLLEKMEYAADQKSFTMQFYVPIYKKLFEDNKYNLLVNHIFSGIDIKSIQEFGKKHKKEIDDFIQYSVPYFNKIRQTRTLDFAARNEAKIFYLFNNGTCTGKGAWTENNGNLVLYGPWEFYYNNGQLKSKGIFGDNEAREGEWIFYYETGIRKELSSFRNDTAEGKSILWFDNGTMSEDRSLKKGEIDGEMKTYFYNGLLRSVGNYSMGKKNGPMKGYRSTGELEYTSEFKNDLQDGRTVFYHANGKEASVSNFVNGLAEGKYQKMYDNGAVETEGSNTKGKNNGTVKDYYPSGKLKDQYVQVDDLIEGEFTSYYENGKIKEKLFYVKGKLEKKDEEFDEKGRLYAETIYEKGKLRDTKSIDTTGKVLSQGTLRNGPAKLSFYDMYLRKHNEGMFNKDGQRHGKSTYYFITGKVSNVSEFVDGSLNGTRTIYYRNNAESEKVNFTDDKENGYFTSFYPDGKPKEEGWYVEEKRQGNFIGYNSLSRRISDIYYRNNELDGYTNYYHADGKKDYEMLFDEGWLKRITQFDTLGKVLSETDLHNGDGELLFKHYNGKPYIKTSYRHYYKNGRSDVFYFDGTVNSVDFYKNGMRDSISRDYFYGGQLQYEGVFVNGNKEGIWKTYYENGKLSMKESFKHGNYDGKLITYNEDGSLDKEINYKDGSLDGEHRYYGDNGALALVLNYRNSELESYTYENKEGKLIPPVQMKNGTGLVTGYYKNGQKSAEINFEEGQVYGMRKLYFTNGNIYIDGPRTMNLEHGTKKIYDKNGQLLRQEVSVYDNRQGPSVTYYASGKLRSEENWYCDGLHGTSKYYDETGKLKETRIYYYGLLQAVIKP